MTISRSGRAIVLLVAGVLTAACAPAEPQNVFRLDMGLSGTIPTRVKEITDAGVPDLANTSSHQVRLRSIKIVDQPRPLHILNVRTYNINHVGYEGVLGQEGDLPSECPGQFVPHPIDSFIVAPHKHAAYFIVIAFTFSKPGRYHLKRLRIYYTANGQDGWQYQNFDRTYIVTNPPLPGLRPIPKSAVCGRP